MAIFRSWKSYWEFEQSVKRSRRFIYNAEIQNFLEAVAETAPSRKVILPQGEIFWRAQLGHDWEPKSHHGETIDVPCAYPADRMKPLQDRASDGRANPNGIPCLYVATTKRTAMSEVRPWIGSYISVAQFRILRQLEIIDCTRLHHKNPLYLQEPSQEEIAKAVWANIDKGFAKPITRGDDNAVYVPTQIIAETFKHMGFDGILYKSSLTKDGFNVALFDIDSAELINCGLNCVDTIEMEFSEKGGKYFMKNYYDKL